MTPLNTPRKQHRRLIIEEILDVLRGHGCAILEAKNVLVDVSFEYEALIEEAWERQQAALMESGGADDSQYRAELIAAGRGHLVKP